VPLIHYIGGWTYASKGLGHIMLGGVLASIAIVATLFGMLKWRSDEFDKTSMAGLSIGVLLLWLIPWGVFMIILYLLPISFISPAGREEWIKFRNRRVAISLVLLILLNAFALYPVSTPTGADEWGKPFATENPHASAWPASEQYTWLHDGAVIGVLNSRTPHTFSPWSQDSSTVTLGVMLGMHDERMRQSIDLLEFIDSDTFWLEEVDTTGAHRYGDDTQYIARFNVKRDGFEMTLATVLIVGFPNAGGEVSLLSITRPIIPSQDDVFEEKLVLQYINR